MIYRKIDSDGDRVFGGGRNDFSSDLPAVTQAVLTRLRLLLGEWWEDQSDGLPLFQNIVNSFNGYNTGIPDMLIQSRILGTVNVLGIIDFKSSYDPIDRGYTFQATINTAFGMTSIYNVDIVPGL